MHFFLIKLYVLDWNWKKRCGNHNHLYLFKKVSWFRIPLFLICNDGQDTQSFVSKLVLFFAKNKIQCHNAVILKKKSAAWRIPQNKELHHKKAITLLFVVRRSRLGPIQSQAVLKRPKWRASAKVAESPVMIIKSVFSL